MRSAATSCASAGSTPRRVGGARRCSRLLTFSVEQGESIGAPTLVPLQDALSSGVAAELELLSRLGLGVVACALML